VFDIPGYVLFRRDRQRRRGGGVAIYARNTLQVQPSVWTYSARKYELLWKRVGDTFVGALYHPPRPQYSSKLLLTFIEQSINELQLTAEYPAALIILAGDFNQLTDNEIIERTGLTLIHQPIRGTSKLDQIRVRTSILYSSCRDICGEKRPSGSRCYIFRYYAGSVVTSVSKTKTRRRYRPVKSKTTCSVRALSYR